MAKFKCETVRYDVTSQSTHRRGVIIQRRWVRSEKIGGRYWDRTLRTELRDGEGHQIEMLPDSQFRCVDSGEIFCVEDFSRSSRAVMIAA